MAKLLKDWEEAAVRIGPESYTGARGGCLSCFLNAGKSCKHATIGKQNPSGQEDLVLVVIRVGYEDGVFSKVLRGGSHDGLQIQMAIGDVHGQNTVRPQVTKIKLKSLNRKEMNRNRVAREGVYGQQIKLLRRLTLQDEARVSHFERNMRF